MITGTAFYPLVQRLHDCIPGLIPVVSFYEEMYAA
jgi:hypothetical protein